MNKQLWQEIAWNGIRFTCPAHWHISQFASKHIVLEDETSCRMEIKWSKVKGRFSPLAYLNKLNRLNKGKFGKHATVTPIPTSWEYAVGRFQCMGFSWQDKIRTGRGVILYCARCKTVTFIQFYLNGIDIPRQSYAKILASFKDHRNDGNVQWSMFDIYALAPLSYQLKNRQFESGFIKLTLGWKKQSIDFYRWGPASVILSDCDLTTFLINSKTISDDKTATQTIGEFQGLKWESSKPHPFKKLIFGNLGSTQLYKNIFAWHVKKKNRIMAIAFSGRSPFDKELMLKIISRYETK